MCMYPGLILTLWTLFLFDLFLATLHSYTTPQQNTWRTSFNRHQVHSHALPTASFPLPLTTR
jgi:hypothetical protein